MLMSNKEYKLRKSQEGFASLVIAIVIVLVLSLMTVGFAQLMQREQRSALDKQLSSQAYYAAESGINDAAKAINAGFATAKTTCAPLPVTATGLGVDFLKNNTISGATASSYSCLLIDPAPFYLEYGSVDTAGSKVLTLTGIDPNNPTQYAVIDSINIGWQDSSAAQTNFVPGSSHTFTTAANWSYTGIVRIGLTPLSSGNINRTALNNNTMNAFLFPKGSNSPIPTHQFNDYSSINNNGGILDGNCSTTRAPTSKTPRYCNVKISNLGQVNYLLSLRSIYSKSRVTITAYDSSDNPLRIKNSQTLVDSTGKAQDVLRRVQVRIPSHNGYVHPDYDLQTTGNICKQLKLTPDNNFGYNCN